MDNINHYGPLRLRVTGSGNLDMRLIALYEDLVADNPPTQTLPTFAMSTATPRLPSVLANFIQQYAQLEIKVDAIDEYFLINKIVFFTKPMWADYPR
jgi:hypothetical protein